jgi:hypothetical protein
MNVGDSDVRQEHILAGECFEGVGLSFQRHGRAAIGTTDLTHAT